MNIQHVLQTCTMITGGGGIPPLVVHAYAVYTRRFFLPLLHPLLAPGYEATIIPFCTAITMQYNGYVIRSQSVLTTNSTGRVYNVQFERVRVQGTVHEQDS